MEITEFAEHVEEMVSDALGGEYLVRRNTVQKNNGVVLEALAVSGIGETLAPTVYLEPYFEAYNGGVSMEEIAKRLIGIYQTDAGRGSIDLSYLQDFTKVKDRICYRLLDEKRNRERLEDLPHVPFLNLIVGFYYSYQDDRIGNGIIEVRREHMEKWHTSTEELLRLARVNTPRLFPAHLYDMCELLHGMVSEGVYLPEASYEELPLRVLSNEPKSFGAACILYPEVGEYLAGKSLKGRYYVIPSSVHELLFLEDTGELSAEDIREMIAEVNAGELLPEEILSESVYYYDTAEGELRIA